MILVNRSSELELKTKRLEHAVLNYTAGLEASLGQKIARLNMLNPLEVLNRGYAAVYKNDNEILTGVSEIKSGDSIRIEFSDGSAYASVTKTELK